MDSMESKMRFLVDEKVDVRKETKKEEISKTDTLINNIEHLTKKLQDIEHRLETHLKDS